jgi:hypothetical protein
MWASSEEEEAWTGSRATGRQVLPPPCGGGPGWGVTAASMPEGTPTERVSPILLDLSRHPHR